MLYCLSPWVILVVLYYNKQVKGKQYNNNDGSANKVDGSKHIFKQIKYVKKSASLNSFVSHKVKGCNLFVLVINRCLANIIPLFYRGVYIVGHISFD